MPFGSKMSPSEVAAKASGKPAPAPSSEKKGEGSMEGAAMMRKMWAAMQSGDFEKAYKYAKYVSGMG